MDERVCRECDASGGQDALLCCAGCDSFWHSSCLKAPNPARGTRGGVRGASRPADRFDWFGPCCGEPGGLYIPIKDDSQDADPEAAGDAAAAPSSDVVCAVCGTGGEVSALMLCEGCQERAHTYCQSPPLPALPVGSWFCEHCAKPVLPAAQPAAAAAKRLLPSPRGAVTNAKAAKAADWPEPAPKAAAPQPPPAIAPPAAAPPPLKPSASSGVSSILANAIWKKPAPVVVAAPVFSGICSVPASLPAGGVVWRGPLSYDGAADAAALGSVLESLRIACEIVARPPATGNPGAGAEGISRAVAAGVVLSGALQLQWLSATAPEWPALWEPLALLRFSAANPGDEQSLAALETALDASAAAGALVCVVPSATLLLRTQASLPVPLRPAARAPGVPAPLQRQPVTLYGLLLGALSAPAVPSAPPPLPSVRPSRSILRASAPAADAAPPSVPPPPPPGQALAGLRFTLLGFSGDEPRARTAVDAAMQEGARYVVAPLPHNVDLVVIEPLLLHRLPEFALRLPDFAAVRSVRFVAGTRHVEESAAARRLLDPRLDTRCELFPEGAIVVTDAATLATCEGAARNVITLLCRCAAASNAAAAATAVVPLGETLPKPPVWPWRLLLNPAEWAELQRLAPTSETAAAAVATIEEALSGPGPGVGTTGVPRAAVMQPEEMSRSITADPPQVVRDTVKTAAAYAAGCRMVFLMSSDGTTLLSGQQQRSIVAGEPDEVCSALQSWLTQIRESHPGARLLAAGDAAAAPMDEAGGDAQAASGARRKGVVFGAVVDDGGTRYGERGGYSAPLEGHAGGGEAEARPAAKTVSRKREREGAALGAHHEDEPDTPAADDAQS